MYQTIEERVANLEGKVEEHTRAWEDIKDHLINHDAKMIAFEQRIDRRFEAVDRRFEAMERRFEAMERKIEALDNRISALDQKFSRYFLWMIGFQFTTLLSMIAIAMK